MVDLRVQNKERIKVCLEEYGNFYNYQVTDTNIAHLANLIKTRSGAKKESEQAMAKILSRGWEILFNF